MNNEVVDPIGAVFLDSPLNFRPHIFMIFFFLFSFSFCERRRCLDKRVLGNSKGLLEGCLGDKFVVFGMPCRWKD